MKNIDTSKIPPENLEKIKAKAAKRPPVIDNTELVADFRKRGGQILHIHPDGRRTRGMTVAFTIKSGRAEVATAVQHRVDAYTKKIGTRSAIERFNKGHVINLPTNGRGREAVRDLKAAFVVLCGGWSI